jgi:aryl-alcohol dehydrogenase-like predicted oxidoreductase
MTPKESVHQETMELVSLSFRLRKRMPRILQLHLDVVLTFSIMQKRKIGSLDVTVVGLGCNNFGWRIDADGTTAVVDAAIESGVNFFDTADRYGRGSSEEYLGCALGRRRDTVIIATKFGMEVDEGQSGASPKYVREAIEASLKRLRTDRIDLYQLHQPDPKTPITDTLDVLNDLVRAGKVREIGCSNFSIQQLREAEATAKGGVKFVSVQNEFSLFHRAPETDGVLTECESHRLAFLPYFPLANGLLTGKYRVGKKSPAESRAADKFGPDVFTKKNVAIVESLIDFAAKRERTILELAFAWLLAHGPVASVIAGASKPEQVRTNATAAYWQLSANDLAEVAVILNSK